MGPILPRRARRILVAAAVIHVALFVQQAWRAFAKLVHTRQCTVTLSDRMGPFVRASDCLGYYAWLRSPLIDGDFQFDEELAPIRDNRTLFPLTATGHRANHWPIGPAIVWAPAVIAVHLVLLGLGRGSPWPADGYSHPYQLAAGGTTLLLALLTLVLVYRMGRRYSGPTPAAAAAALITLATPLVVYGTVEVCMAHGIAAAFLSLFVFVWLRSFGSRKPARWLGLGCLLGLTSLMRWQLSTFAVLPALEALWIAGRATGWPGRIRVVMKLASTGLAALIVFSPHFLAKQIVYGHPFGGLHHVGHNWFAPSLWTVLFTADRGLFYWNPITIPALASLIYASFRFRDPPLMILTVGVLMQIYLVAALLGQDVFLGLSFGFRMLTETCALMAPGLAVLLDRATARTAKWLMIAGGVLVGWNLLLLGVYRHDLGGTVAGAGPVELWEMVGQYFMARPLKALAMVAAAGWLIYYLVDAFRSDRPKFRRSPRCSLAVPPLKLSTG